jgi:hypothetical protein
VYKAASEGIMNLADKFFEMERAQALQVGAGACAGQGGRSLWDGARTGAAGGGEYVCVWGCGVVRDGAHRRCRCVRHAGEKGMHLSLGCSGHRQGLCCHKHGSYRECSFQQVSFRVWERQWDDGSSPQS